MCVREGGGVGGCTVVRVGGGRGGVVVCVFTVVRVGGVVGGSCVCVSGEGGGVGGVYGSKSRWGEGGGSCVFTVARVGGVVGGSCVCVCVCVCVGGGGVCGGCTEVRVGWEGVVVCVLVRVRWGAEAGRGICTDDIQVCHTRRLGIQRGFRLVFEVCQRAVFGLRNSAFSR